MRRIPRSRRHGGNHSLAGALVVGLFIASWVVIFFMIAAAGDPPWSAQ